MNYELSPNLTLLFSEAGTRPADRVRAAAAAGFRYVDTWALPGEDDLADYQQALSDTGITVTVATARAKDIINDPARRAEALSALEESVPLARAIGARDLVVVGGQTLQGVSALRQREAIVDYLHRAADIVSGTGVGIVIENLNSRVDHMGCFLDSTLETIAIAREVRRPEVGVLYDAYHSLMMDEHVRDVLNGAMDVVRHVQVADVPGRHEPGSGRVDWRVFLSDLDAVGYRGSIGLEYWPTVETRRSLRVLQHANGA